MDESQTIENKCIPYLYNVNIQIRLRGFMDYWKKENAQSFKNHLRSVLFQIGN